MLILIDGHNLVPKIPGMSLSDFDDEMKLVEMLQNYARLRRKKIEVFFDKPPAGWPRTRVVGTIKIRFSHLNSTADEEIRERLTRLGKEARNCLVVSSDFRVQGYGKNARAQVVSSDRFAQELIETIADSSTTLMDEKDIQMSVSKIDEWLKLFGESGKKSPPKNG